MVAVLLQAGCGLAAPDPPRLEYRVTPTEEGIAVALRVDGWRGRRAWVAFTASDLGPGPTARRIFGVTAHDAAGGPLPVEPAGVDAWQVEIGPADVWTVEYSVALLPLPPRMVHRASSRSPQHLVLVGSDVWASIHDSPGPLADPPADRLPAAVSGARVLFDTASLPTGWRVVSAAREVALDTFVVDGHPHRTVFAAGPYHVETIDDELGVQAAIHRDWPLARDTLVDHTRRLLRATIRELGPPPGEPALFLYTPLPESARPADGVRTAGMVWDRTLNLLAGGGPRVPASSRTIREMVAIFLGHEIFHLYVPWGLPVTRPLSWLSEGWASHMGRRMAHASRLLGAGGVDATLRTAHERYIELGGARAGSLRDASESGDEMRDLLYVRGELVFRVLSLSWDEKAEPISFDAALWRRLVDLRDDEQAPIRPEQVSRVLSELVDPVLVRRVVDGSAPITLTDLELGRR